MIDKLYSICKTLRLNSKLCINCFADVSEEDVLKRIGDAGNSMSFILIHIINARYFLAKTAGVHLANPYKENYKNVNSIEDYISPPPINELLDNWKELSDLLVEVLENINEEELNKKFDINLPIDDNTVWGAITFLTQHDSYHLGQLALLRKQLGYEAMLYT